MFFKLSTEYVEYLAIESTGGTIMLEDLNYALVDFVVFDDFLFEVLCTDLLDPSCLLDSLGLVEVMEFII
jgi:hypothetical protein